MQRRFNRYFDLWFNLDTIETMKEEKATVLAFEPDEKGEYSEEDWQEMRRLMGEYLIGASVLLDTCYEAKVRNYNQGGREMYEECWDAGVSLLREDGFSEEQIDEIRAMYQNSGNTYDMRENFQPYIDFMWENWNEM